MCVAKKVQILCQKDHQNVEWIELSWKVFSQQLVLTQNALFMNIFNSYWTIFFPGQYFPRYRQKIVILPY